jgi:hypothetical protein
VTLLKTSSLWIQANQQVWPGSTTVNTGVVVQYLDTVKMFKLAKDQKGDPQVVFHHIQGGDLLTYNATTGVRCFTEMNLN